MSKYKNSYLNVSFFKQTILIGEKKLLENVGNMGKDIIWLAKKIVLQIHCKVEHSHMSTSKFELFILSRAGPEKMPWVRMAYTLVAPASISLDKNDKTTFYSGCTPALN